MTAFAIIQLIVVVKVVIVMVVSIMVAVVDGYLFCLRYTPTFTLISRKKQKADLGGGWYSGHSHSGDGGCGLIKVALFVVMVMLVLPRAAVVMVGGWFVCWLWSSIC